jgi:hypothetical protein
MRRVLSLLVITGLVTVAFGSSDILIKDLRMYVNCEEFVIKVQQTKQNRKLSVWLTVNSYRATRGCVITQRRSVWRR